jgi:hypothetical protein
MKLKEILEQEIDEDRFYEIFDALFVHPEGVMTADFYDNELERAARDSPLLSRLADKVDELALDLAGQGMDEQTIRGITQGRAIACIAIAAYADSEAFP